MSADIEGNAITLRIAADDPVNETPPSSVDEYTGTLEGGALIVKTELEATADEMRGDELVESEDEMCIRDSSRPSRTPLRRPSMMGRMPIFGSEPHRRLTGFVMGMDFGFAFMMSTSLKILLKSPSLYNRSRRMASGFRKMM